MRIVKVITAVVTAVVIKGVILSEAKDPSAGGSSDAVPGFSARPAPAEDRA